MGEIPTGSSRVRDEGIWGPKRGLGTKKGRKMNEAAAAAMPSGDVGRAERDEWRGGGGHDPDDFGAASSAHPEMFPPLILEAFLSTHTQPSCQTKPQLWYC